MYMLHMTTIQVSSTWEAVEPRLNRSDKYPASRCCELSSHDIGVDNSALKSQSNGHKVVVWKNLFIGS